MPLDGIEWRWVRRWRPGARICGVDRAYSGAKSRLGPQVILNKADSAVDVPIPGTFTAKKADFAVAPHDFGTSTAREIRLTRLFETPDPFLL